MTDNEARSKANSKNKSACVYLGKTSMCYTHIHFLFVNVFCSNSQKHDDCSLKTCSFTICVKAEKKAQLGCSGSRSAEQLLMSNYFQSLLNSALNITCQELAENAVADYNASNTLLL